MTPALSRTAFALAALAAALGCDPRSEPIRVRVTPENPRLVPHEAVAFHANVRSSTGDGVEWSLEGVEGAEVLGAGAIGTIDANGVFHAPPRVPPDWANVVTVYACSVVDPGTCGESEITFEPAPVDPSRGRREEFTWVRIGGEDIVDGSRVFFGDRESEETFFDSEVLIWASAPDSDVLGAVDVVVERPDGTRITWPLAFEYGAEIVSLDGGQLLTPCAGVMGRPAYGVASDGAPLQVLAVPCPDAGGVAVLFGDDAGSFLIDLPSGIAAPGAAPQGTFFADLLGDAADELVVARAGALDVYGFPSEKPAPATAVVLLATIPDPGLSAGAPIRGIGISLDADGRDLAWADGQRGTIQLAHGDGTAFGAVESIAASAVSAIGVIDSGLVWAGDGGVTVLVATNGGWTVADVEAIPGASTDLAIGDVDGDLRGDVVVAHGTGVSLLRRSSSGPGLEAAESVSLGPVSSIALRDVDGDGRADVLFASPAAAPSYGQGGSVVLMHGGPSGLGAPIAFAALDAPLHVLAAPLDGDAGVPEILVSHAGAIEVRRGGGAGWAWKRDATGADPRSVALAIGYGAEPVAFAAVEGTGGPSLVVLHAETGAILQSIPLPAAAARLRVLAADLDGDGIAEAIVSDGGPRAGGEASVLVFPGLDASGMVATIPIDVPAPFPVQDVAIGWIDEDALQDLVLVLAGTDGNGTPEGSVAIVRSGLGFAVLEELPIIATHVALADAGFDGSDDLFLSDAAQPRVLHVPVYEGYVDLVESIEAPVGVLAGDLLVRDVDGDFAPDILVMPDGESRVGVLIGGEYHWDPPVWYPFRGVGASLGLADMDGDSLGDLVVTTSAPALAVFRGRDGGLFSGAPAYAIAGVAPGAATLADLDGDGMSDACVADHAGFLVTLTNISF